MFYFCIILFEVIFNQTHA